MSSWASILKNEDRTTGVSKTTHTGAANRAKEEQKEGGRCPLFVYMVRPGAPTVRPIFETYESNAWEQSELDKNHEYSRKYTTKK